MFGKMRDDFILDGASKTYCSCHKITLQKCELYIKSPYWLKIRKNYYQYKQSDKEYFKYVICYFLYIMIKLIIILKIMILNLFPIGKIGIKMKNWEI